MKCSRITLTDRRDYSKPVPSKIRTCQKHNANKHKNAQIVDNPSSTSSESETKSDHQSCRLSVLNLALPKDVSAPLNKTKTERWNRKRPRLTKRKNNGSRSDSALSADFKLSGEYLEADIKKLLLQNTPRDYEHVEKLDKYDETDNNNIENDITDRNTYLNYIDEKISDDDAEKLDNELKLVKDESNSSRMRSPSPETVKVIRVMVTAHPTNQLPSALASNSSTEPNKRQKRRKVVINDTKTSPSGRKINTIRKK